MENLERKIWGVSWKQWIPVFGIYQAVKDHVKEKPSLINSMNRTRYNLGFVYHLAVSFYPIGLCAKTILDKIK